MKFNCNRDMLIEAINIVQKAISSKSSMPILEGIHIEAGDVLKLTGNDLEIGIETLCQASIEEKGSVVLSSKIFGEIIKKLPEGEIYISGDDNFLVKIECQSSYFEIKGLSPEGYPSIPKVNKEVEAKISQGIFKDMINKVIFSVGHDENRVILTGVYIEIKKDNITLVAIDGLRMAVREEELKENESEMSIIVPSKTLTELSRILSASDIEMSIKVEKNQVMFELGETTIVSRLIEGKYYNYKSITPSKYETEFILKTKEIEQTFERAVLLYQENKKCHLKFSIDYSNLVITLQTEDGFIKDEIKIDMTGNTMDIAFNPKLFLEIIKAISEEKVYFKMCTAVGPCTILPIDGKKFIYTIAAVKIGG